MKAKHYCPLCGCILIPGQGMKLKCPEKSCKFIDRRHGNSCIDPAKDRRSGVEIQQAAGMHPWMDVRMR